MIPLKLNDQGSCTVKNNRGQNTKKG